MKKIYLFSLIVSGAMLLFTHCSKIEPLPDIAQPIVKKYVEQETIVVGDTTIIVGPEKEYEQDSKVIFKLVVTSSYDLKKLSSTTSSDAVSTKSRVLRTIPANVIDAAGNFIKPVKEVTVFYEYYIHPDAPILSQPTVSFAFQNEADYRGISSHIYTVIKKGSTEGKRLIEIRFPWADKWKIGIGAQMSIDQAPGWSAGYMFVEYKGPFFSLERKADIWRSFDAIRLADEVDICGYIPYTNGTIRTDIVGTEFYLVSPSDTTILNYKYAGAYAASVRLQGGAAGSTVAITVNGVTRNAVFASNTTTTATNFKNTHLAAYAAAGILVTTSADYINFLLTSEDQMVPPATIVTISGAMYGNDRLGGEPYWISAWAQGNLGSNILMRRTVRAMAKSLEAEGKHLRVAKFKRLDNSTGPDKITKEEFDLLTHDNEFDKYLADVEVSGKTYGGPVTLEQVWGFVLEDGRRGLLRTSNTKDYPDRLAKPNAALEIVKTPKVSPFVLLGIIKYQYPDSK